MFGIALMSALSQHNLSAVEKEEDNIDNAILFLEQLAFDVHKGSRNVFLLNPLGEFLRQHPHQAVITKEVAVPDLIEESSVSLASASSSEEEESFEFDISTSQRERMVDPNACHPSADPDSVRIFDQLALEIAADGEYDDDEFEEDDFFPTPVVSKKSVGVRFEEFVEVVAIPSHQDMDEETRSRLWNNLDDIHANGQRNTLEFIADGWDWQNATEEEDMVYDEYTGLLVHPTTFMELQVQRKRILAQMAAAELAYDDEEYAAYTKSQERRHRKKSQNGSRRHRHRHSYPAASAPSSNTKTHRRSQSMRCFSAASLTRFADT